MAKCECWVIALVVVITLIIIPAVILIPIFVVENSKSTTSVTTTTFATNGATTGATTFATTVTPITSVTSITSVTTVANSSTLTPWPTMNALPFGQSSWKVILEVDVNMSSVNSVNQIINTTVTDSSVTVVSFGTSFSIDVIMTLVSPQYAYFGTSPSGNPIYMTLTPDLVHSNGQCILRINTYPIGTVVDTPTLPTITPIYSLVLILFIFQ